MPDREERFTVITDAVAAFCGDHPHVIDLGCGPGSLAERILTAIPGARVTAVDMDPVLLTIGRHALGDADGRLRFVDADLRERWEEQLDGNVDAAVSTTALHWLQADALTDLYGRLGKIIRSGGVFLNGDRLAFDRENRQISDAARALRDRRGPAGGTAHTPEAETWDEWWAAVEADPGLNGEVSERARRHHDHPEHEHQADLPFHRNALRAAGFREVDTLWQRLSDRVLVGVR